MVKKKRTVAYFILSILAILVFLCVWQYCTGYLELVPSTTLPSPVKVAQSFANKMVTKAPDGATLLQHTVTSLKVALSGYALALVIGIPLGICMAWFEPVDKLVRPIFDLVKPIPGVAWIPLTIVIFGIGMRAKMAVVFMGAVVPVVLNSYTGIRQTKEVHIWVARTFGASRNQMLFRIAIPTALPFIMTGVKVALGSAWISIVAAELMGSTKGLGYMIQQARGILRVDLVIDGMIMIGICGGILTYLLSVVERMVVKGRENHEKK